MLQKFHQISATRNVFWSRFLATSARAADRLGTCQPVDPCRLACGIPSAAHQHIPGASALERKHWSGPAVQVRVKGDNTEPQAASDLAWGAHAGDLNQVVSLFISMATGESGSSGFFSSKASSAAALSNLNPGPSHSSQAGKESPSRCFKFPFAPFESASLTLLLLYHFGTPRIYIFRWFKFQPTTEFFLLAKAARRIVCSRGCCESHITWRATDK